MFQSFWFFLMNLKELFDYLKEDVMTGQTSVPMSVAMVSVPSNLASLWALSSGLDTVAPNP